MCESKKLVFNRRRFLRMVAAGTCAGLGQNLLFPARQFMAMGAVGSGRQVVFLHMAGGWSLNCAPVDHGTYRDKMTAIYPTSALSIGAGDQYLHPAFTRLHARYQQGQLLVINKVRDMNYDRSHETATNNYLSGLINQSNASTQDQGLGARIACLEPGNPLAAISFAGSDAWSGGNCNPALDIDNLDNLGEQGFRWSGSPYSEHLSRARDAVHASATVGTKPREVFVRSAIDNVSATLASLENYQDINTGATFPNTGIGNTMRNIAQIIIGQRNSPLRTAAFLASMGGYDTHSNELTSLTGSLGQVDAALDAFMQSMTTASMANDVALIVFGEFGRTFSNGSGTDHGASQRVFVLGGNVNGGRTANAPESPAECAGQYLTAYDFEFRSVFRQFVEGGLGINGGSVFPEPIPAGDNPVYMFR